MTLNCEDEYFQDFGNGHELLNYDVVSEPTVSLAAACPNAIAASVLIRRPTTDASAASPPWPTSPVPWIVFAHGTDLDADAYEHLVDPLVEKGFAVFLPDTIANSASAGDRAALIECVAEWADTQYAAELGSCFALGGHSTGGTGAFVAAQNMHLNSNPMASRIGALVTLAPEGPLADPLLPVAEQTTPLLVVTGSRDHDVEKGGSSLYEIGSNEGAYDLPSDLNGSVAGRTGEKVFVEAYDVTHSALGGFELNPFGDNFPDPLDELDSEDMIAKGHAFAAAYVPAFLFWQLIGVDSYRPRFADNEYPPELTTDFGWWDYLPQWSNVLEEPLVFTSVSVQRAAS